MACSHGLWFSPERTYPAIPIVSGFPSLPLAIGGLLLALLLVSLAVAAVPKAPRWTSAVPVALLFVLIAFDQSRLQPWIVTYSVVLLLTAFGWPRDGVVSTLRFVIAIEYVWSGVQKANVNFIDHAWPDFSSALTQALHITPGVSHSVGTAAPLIETAVGFALLVPAARRAGVLAACGLHGTILLALIVSGENASVWPWNVAMPLFDIVLFWDAAAEPWRLSALRRFPAGIVAIVFAGVLPALSLWGRWDAYASDALYSGSSAQAVVVVDPGLLNTLPPILLRNTWQWSRPMFVDINRWSYDELGVPVYPESRVFRAVGRYVCRTYRAAASLVILGRPDWRTGARARTRLSCSDPSW